jgi:LysM repeat protein
MRSRVRFLSVLSLSALAGLIMASVAPAAEATEGGAYVVKPGEALSEIAARQGASTAAIAEANGIADPSHVQAGEVLELPDTDGGAVQQTTERSDEAPADTSAGAGSHEVAPGETLSEIAAVFGVSTDALASANGLDDPGYVRAGTELAVPGSQSPSGAASATAPGNAARSAPAGASSRAEIGRLIERTARAHGWNPAFVKAVAWQESGWNNELVSVDGAVGVMQVLPSTGRFVSRNLVGRELDLSDPADNVKAGVVFLDYLHDLTGGNTAKLLGGYVQGLASIQAYGVSPTTERYIENVTALKARFE